MFLSTNIESTTNSYLVGNIASSENDAVNCFCRYASIFAVCSSNFFMNESIVNVFTVGDFKYASTANVLSDCVLMNASTVNVFGIAFDRNESTMNVFSTDLMRYVSTLNVSSKVSRM